MRRECGWCLKFFILLLHLTRRLHATSEADVLRVFKQRVVDPTGVLNSWDTDLDSPCTWFHITCNGQNKVIRVDLGNAQLSGPLIPDLGSLTSLQLLELYNNSISGEIPPELGNLSDLQSLDLYRNNLYGDIPESLGKLTQLNFLRLNNNSLTGTIPMPLTTINKLQVLDISNNNLSGNVPIDGSFSWFTPISFQGNANLCGPGVSKQCPGGPPLPPPPPPLLTSISPPKKSSRGIEPLWGGLAAAAIVFFVAPAVVFALWRRHKRHELFVDIPAEEDSEVHLGQLKRFSLHEIQVATDGFNSKNVLGTGGFGIVYKGRLADGTLVAVKRLKQVRRSGGELQFHTEVEMISLAVHRNLLRLRGFCINHKERLLVYSYMSKGSVASWLRERREGDPPLDWPTRKKIALGSARGLSYLHDYCDPKIIHRDIKAANILLDDEFEAVVGDFGLVKLMNYNDTHVTTAAKGTIGYIAPEYLSTGKASEKTDVFSYGILLLEIITGKQAFDIARISNDDGFLLIDWVMKFIREQRINMLVDFELQSTYDVDEVEKLLKIAQLCTQISPTERPRMSDVIRMLEGEGLAERWEQWQRIEVVRSLATEERTPFTVGPDWNIDSTDNMHPDELSGPR